MNVVKVLVSMPTVHVFSSSALTLCFGLAGKDHTFDGRAFYVHLEKIQVLQASLPVTTYCCTENKLAEISSGLRQPEQIQKDYSQSKLIIKSADLTEYGYPRTLTSSYPSDNVIKTSAEVTRQAAEIT